LRHCGFFCFIGTIPGAFVLPRYAKEYVFFSSLSLCQSVFVSWLTDHAGDFYVFRRRACQLQMAGHSSHVTCETWQASKTARRRPNKLSPLPDLVHAVQAARLSLHPRKSSIAVIDCPFYHARSHTRTLVPPSRFPRSQPNWVKGACPARPRPVRIRKLWL
jgi:hypothetical protein